MYGNAPFGAAPYGSAIPENASDPPPAPSGGGGNFMLLGIRSLVLAALGWLTA